jgi:ketosteroid isomerase-like protein
MIQGKGFFVWQVARCEGGNTSQVANLATQASFSHVLVKIADGTSPYNIASNGDDLAMHLTNALHERNLLSLGWHYVYGYDPIGEANIALQRILQLGLDGYVIDAEAPYKDPGKDVAARQFLARLHEVLPTEFPVALSSYRYPSYHPTFPWQAFLEGVNLNMPQVYWLDAHNPGDQLVRSVREFQGITPFRPIIPTGSAFLQGNWQPTVAEEEEFLRVAQNLNLSAANFWEWAHCRTYLPQIWDAIAAYPWMLDASNLDIVDQYIAALNSHDLARVLALYHPRAALVTPGQTIQGAAALQNWFAVFFQRVGTTAVFSLTESTGSLGSRHFSWKSTSPSGTFTGSDSFGLVEKKITYHYTQSTLP